MNKQLKLTIALLTVMTVIGCMGKDDSPIADKSSGRWFTKEQVVMGKQVFRQNCSICHGQNAEQTINWKQRLPDGSYPPPPLNGSAHAWHHPLSVLKMTINQGGAQFGGKMPGFKSKLSQDEITSAIAFFQNYWSDEIYNAWLERGGLD